MCFGVEAEYRYRRKLFADVKSLVQHLPFVIDETNSYNDDMMRENSHFAGKRWKIVTDYITRKDYKGLENNDSNEKIETTILPNGIYSVKKKEELQLSKNNEVTVQFYQTVLF